MKRTIMSIIATSAMAVCTASASLVIWSEGFNSDFSSPYSASFGNPLFGVSLPGIITDGSLTGIEGDGFAAANTSLTNTSGTASILSGMDINLGAVAEAGVKYTFSGEFGWRYGTLAAASDLGIHYGQTGFVVDGTTHTAGDFLPFNFGTSTSGQAQLTTHDFSYTTVASDVGKDILVRIRLVDQNNDGTLTQLLTDDWQVTAVPEPAALGLLGAVGAMILFIRRRFMI